MPDNDAGISSRLTLVLALAAGLSVANLYYAQPLLATIATTFDTSEGATGLVVTGAQIGYAAGLALVVPVGDLLERRRIVTVLLSLSAVVLLAAAAAPSLWVLVIAVVLVGLCTSTAQVLIPFAATLASDGERGRVVGTVMTGLLLGILLARTVSGLLSELVGWRGVFVVAAGVAAVLCLVLRRELPVVEPTASGRYAELLRSVLALLGQLPELRRSALLGGLVFATFSVFWTTIAFHLHAAPFGYSDAKIGLVGLAGAAGALFAMAAGRLADRGLAVVARPVLAAVLAASFGLLWSGRHSIVWILVAVVVLDVAIQGVQVLNQSVIYELAPDARSRITSAYMTCYFVGGAIGSAVASALYQARGWAATCVLGAALALCAVLVAAPGRRGVQPAT